ncbi:hypothetical protein ACQPT2_07880 [Erwinia amylovora]
MAGTAPEVKVKVESFFKENEGNAQPTHPGLPGQLRFMVQGWNQDEQ